MISDYEFESVCVLGVNGSRSLSVVEYMKTVFYNKKRQTQTDTDNFL